MCVCVCVYLQCLCPRQLCDLTQCHAHFLLLTHHIQPQTSSWTDKSDITLQSRTSPNLTQNKGHGDQTGVVVAVNGQFFKVSLLVVMEEESERVERHRFFFHWYCILHHVLKPLLSLCSPVGGADGSVHGEEGQELLVQNLVDATFPDQQQFGETTESGVCHSSCVGDRHWLQSVDSDAEEKGGALENNQHTCGWKT